MVLARQIPIQQVFNMGRVAPPRGWTKLRALQTIKRYLIDEAYPEEVDEALDFLEDEYPRARELVRRMRCYVLFEEFFEYEQRLVVCGSHFRQLTLHL